MKQPTPAGHHNDEMKHCHGNIDEPYRVDIIGNIEDVHAIGEAWDRLLMESANCMPMLSYSWVTSFFETMLGPTESWRCFLLYMRDELQGIVPLVIRKDVFVSYNYSNAYTPYNNHSYSGGFIIKKELDKEILKQFLNEVFKHIHPKALTINVRGVSECSAEAALSDDKTSDFKVHSDLDRLGSYLPIGQSIQEYYGGLGANFRANLKKCHRKLARYERIEFDYLSEDEATPDKLKMFMKLEASGWKGRKGTAILFRPELISFYSRLVERLSERRLLEWHILKLNGIPAAAHLATRIGGSIFLIKIAYDERFSKVAPGNMLFFDLVEKAYRNGDINEINCLTEMRWHNNWAMAKRKFLDVYLFNKCIESYIMAYLPKKSKCFVKKLLGENHLFKRFLRCA